MPSCSAMSHGPSSKNATTGSMTSANTFKGSDIHLSSDWDLATLPNKSFVSRRCSRCSSNLFEHLASLTGGMACSRLEDPHSKAPD